MVVTKKRLNGGNRLCHHCNNHGLAVVAVVLVVGERCEETGRSQLVLGDARSTDRSKVQSHILQLENFQTNRANCTVTDVGYPS